MPLAPDAEKSEKVREGDMKWQHGEKYLCASSSLAAGGKARQLGDVKTSGRQLRRAAVKSAEGSLSGGIWRQAAGYGRGRRLSLHYNVSSQRSCTGWLLDGFSLSRWPGGDMPWRGYYLSRMKP